MRAARASASSRVCPARQRMKARTGRVAGGERSLIRLPLESADSGVLEAGHSLFVEFLRDVLDAFLHLLHGQRRDEVGDETLSQLFQHSGRSSVGIAIDRAARGIESVRVDLRELQREAIGDSVVAHGVGEPDRVLRRDRVEVLCVDVPTLLELSFVPPASLDPVAAPRGRHLFLDVADDILDALHLGIGKVRDLEHVSPAPREMTVSIEESRGRGAAREVDDPRILSRELSDLGVGADGE